MAAAERQEAQDQHHDELMNQIQRKFLLDAVEKQFKKEKDVLIAEKPKEPSLNNYLMAAILDGSFTMRPAEEIRTAVRERVRNMGKEDSLLTTKDRWSEQESKLMALPVEVLFDMPAGYTEVLHKYEEELREWNAKMEALKSALSAMQIKIQIGSDKALAPLIDEADKLCSLSLVNSSKLLFAPEVPTLKN